MKRFIATFLMLLPIVGGIACAKKIDGEDPKAAKARKTAVYSAQTVTAFDTFHNVTAVLQDNGAISADAAISAYKFNDKALTSFDVLRGRLEQGLPDDAIARIEAIISDVEAFERDLNAISDPNAKAKFAEAIFTIRFTLNSIRAVIEANKEPNPTELRARISRQAAGRRPAWWTDAILAIQNGLIKALEQSRLTAAEAWTDASALSGQVHAKNKGRIG